MGLIVLLPEESFATESVRKLLTQQDRRFIEADARLMERYKGVHKPAILAGGSVYEGLDEIHWATLHRL